MGLGMLPKNRQDKVAMLQIIAQACQSTVRSEMVSRVKKNNGLGFAMMFLYSGGASERRFSELHDVQDPSSWLQYQTTQNQRIDFKAFLGLLSEVRAWNHRIMREELLGLFEKRLKRRNAPGAVLSVPEVCKALEELKMAPNNVEEQIKIKEFLEISNEWGFDPPSLDFEDFVVFIRKMREFSTRAERAAEGEYAWKHLQLDERRVNAYRMAFDILDTEGDSQLNIAAVRKVFVLIRVSITSDHLRELFGKIDLDGSGTIGFLEFLHLARELDVLGTFSEPVESTTVAPEALEHHAEEAHHEQTHKKKAVHFPEGKDLVHAVPSRTTEGFHMPAEIVDLAGLET